MILAIANEEQRQLVTGMVVVDINVRIRCMLSLIKVVVVFVSTSDEKDKVLRWSQPARKERRTH